MLALSTILTTGLVGLAVLDSVNAASVGQRAINAKKVKTSVFARAFSHSTSLSFKALEVDELTCARGSVLQLETTPSLTASLFRYNPPPLPPSS